jgi:hypothetical protein
MRLAYLVFGLGLLCFGGVASAADAPQQTQSNSEQQTTSGQQQVAEQSDKEEKKICKREPMTGTLLGAKVCKTQKEWDDQAKGDGPGF